MSDYDIGFDLLPSDGALLSSDPVLDDALGVNEDPGPQPLGRGWAFDFDTGQFIRSGSAPAVVYELNNLRVWVEKTLRTARLAHPIYTDEYGVEEPFLLVGRQMTPELLGLYTANLREALLVHDRITDVTGFALDHDPDNDTVTIAFEVVVDDDAVLRIDSTFGGT